MPDTTKIENVVWTDIPVANLERAQLFYHAVLGHAVHIEQHGDIQFGVLEHKDGNGGCLCVDPAHVGATGPLIYLSVEGRIRHAVEQVEQHEGKILKPIHAIGPYGFCAQVLDSEGNRIALHSMVDA